MLSIIDKIHDMLKSEEHTQEILASQLSTEKRARRAAEKKAYDAEFRISTLLDKVNGCVIHYKLLNFKLLKSPSS